MKELLSLTLWEMETPEAYGAFHLITTAVLLLCAVFAAYLLRKTSDKQNRIVLGCIGLLLLFLELYKLLVHVFLDPYRWGGFFGVFPFQLCSVPMYLCIFCAACPIKRINEWLYEFMFAVSMVGGIMAFVEPSGINHKFVALTLHAYIWHMSLIFIGLYLYLSGRVCRDRKSFLKAATFYLFSCAVAQGFNVLYKGKVNCFYISPYHRTSLAVFGTIYDKWGWEANAVLLILAVLLGAAAVYYTGYFFRTRKTKK